VKRFLSRLLGVPGAPPSRPAGDGERDKTNWKAKAAEALDRAKAFERDARHQAQRADKLQGIVESLEHRDAEVERLREQLAAVERELTVAREQLMVVEVKLDILEGAANVLDARTRVATRPQAQETGAAV
jgi:phage shock protein A